jgi:RNA polymerase-binding transcription factor DksA
MNDIHKARLEEEKARLEAQLSTVGRRNPSNPNDWEATAMDSEPEPDPNDRATQLDAYQENETVLTDLEIRYNDVKAALARIDAGTYGICEVGGEAIEPERLEADPAAHTCTAHIAA